MKIKHLPGAPGNHKTLPLSHRTMHLMQMQLQRQPEQQHQEGGGDPPGGGGDPPAKVEFTPEQQTEMQRIIDESLAAQKRKIDADAETAKTQAEQKAAQDKLREQGEFEKLAGTERERADKAEREIAELKLNADRIAACQAAELDIKHASRLVGTNLAELTADAKEFAKSIPLPKAPGLQQSGTQGGSSSGGQQNGNGGGNGNNGGGGNAPFNPGLQHVNDRYFRPDKKRS